MRKQERQSYVQNMMDKNRGDERVGKKEKRSRSSRVGSTKKKE